MGQRLDDFRVQPKTPQVPLSLLQRLGQPALAPTDLHFALGAAYRGVPQRAEALAFSEERG